MRTIIELLEKRGAMWDKLLTTGKLSMRSAERIPGFKHIIPELLGTGKNLASSAAAYKADPHKGIQRLMNNLYKLRPQSKGLDGYHVQDLARIPADNPITKHDYVSGMSRMLNAPMGAIPVEKEIPGLLKQYVKREGRAALDSARGLDYGLKNVPLRMKLRSAAKEKAIRDASIKEI